MPPGRPQSNLRLRGSRPGETPLTALQRIRQRPFQAAYEARRIVSYPLYWLYFRLHGVTWQPGWRIYGRPLIQRYRGSTITIGEQAHLRSWLHSNPLGVNHRVVLATWSSDAEITIGDGFGMTGGSLCAQDRIVIGDDVRIGANSTVTDTDFHPLEAQARTTTKQDGVSRPVVIADRAFIGANCVILKGVSIGEGAVVGAGSVVNRDVPAGTTVAGNPAIIVRQAST